MAELVDALGSGSSVLTDVEVQVLSRASKKVIGFMSITFFCCRDLREDLKRASADQREDEPPWKAAEASEAACNPEPRRRGMEGKSSLGQL